MFDRCVCVFRCACFCWFLFLIVLLLLDFVRCGCYYQGCYFYVLLAMAVVVIVVQATAATLGEYQAENAQAAVRLLVVSRCNSITSSRTDFVWTGRNDKNHGHNNDQ